MNCLERVVWINQVARGAKRSQNEMLGCWMELELGLFGSGFGTNRFLFYHSIVVVFDNCLPLHPKQGGGFKYSLMFTPTWG